ncbi:hypothetical protein BAE44_0008775 [Dichanthelium oligosanthes]|uniref:Uncharacterized protein n=1 Tax=Dichanthelium oligosanthes TaxID=888268 RepID=A0A1E5VYL5_9POAL|nr:hypothetical protein BAE44_0008775 [Dichanthelium oligosanthes]
MDKDTEAVTAHLEKGGIMVGSFPISCNYFSLRPEEVYVYQPDKAITHDKSGLPASHVGMMIGIGHRLNESKRFTRHMVMQNSEGELFGTNGIARIGKKQTLRKLYWIEVEGLKPKAAPSTPRRRRHRCYYRRHRAGKQASDAQREASSSAGLACGTYDAVSREFDTDGDGETMQ